MTCAFLRTLIAVCVVTFLLAVACGGGGEDDFGLMTFDGEPADGSSEGAAGSFEAPRPSDVAVSGLVLEEVNYLFSHQVWLESLQQLNRDMMTSLELDTEGSPGLDWVIEAHQLTRDADELYAFVLASDIPEAQRPTHFSLRLEGLRVVQVMAYGSDRLLAAALVIGPTGRVAADLSPGEYTRFQTYVREARFFLRDAERLLEDDIEELGGVISAVNLR